MCSNDQQQKVNEIEVDNRKQQKTVGKSSILVRQYNPNSSLTNETENINTQTTGDIYYYCHRICVCIYEKITWF